MIVQSFLGNQKLGKIVRHETTNSKGSEDLKDDFKWCLHVLFNSRKTSHFNTNVANVMFFNAVRTKP